jgi:hypothetical protein
MSMDNSEVLQLEDAQRLADRAVAKIFAVKGDMRFEHINESVTILMSRMGCIALYRSL